MPICRHCGVQWGWRTAAMASLSLKEEKICPYCRDKQYLSTKSKKRGTMIVMLPMFGLFLSNAAFDLDLTATLLLTVPLVAIAFALMPFTIELSNKPEPLW